MRLSARRAQHKRRFRRDTVVYLMVLPVAILVLAGVACAEPYVFFEPEQTLVQPGDPFELSFRVGACDDSIASFQLYMSFDPQIVELTAAVEGTLYAQSGHMTWFIAEEKEPGFWHFFDTVFGVGSHILGPGELLHLSFEAQDYGLTQAHVDTIRMTDIRRNPLPVGGFEHADIFVIPSTGVDEEPVAALRLGPAQPNPFTTDTRIPFSLPSGSRGWQADIYDVAGRHVKCLSLPNGVTCGTLSWKGDSDSGRAVPASVYFVKLLSELGEARATLIRLR